MSGTLTVIKDLHMKEPYVGTIDLLGGEIAEDIASYFVESEQIPTACGLGVLVDRDQSVTCRRRLPYPADARRAGEDTIAKVEGGVLAAGACVATAGARTTDPEHLLRTVMCGLRCEDFGDATRWNIKCYCSRERVERALISLGAAGAGAHAPPSRAAAS